MKNFLTIALALIAVAFTSCNSNSDDPNQPDVYTDFATLLTMNSEGCTFQVQKDANSDAVILTSKENIDKAAPNTFKVGMRVVIMYYSESGMQYTGGPIQLLRITTTLGEGAPVEVSTSEKTNKWASDQITMYMVGRTGDYLNFQFTHYGTVNVKECKLYVDEETLDDEYPHLHLVYEDKNDHMQSTSTYAYYASWSIKDLWARPNLKGVNVYFADLVNQGPVVIKKTVLTPME